MRIQFKDMEELIKNSINEWREWAEGNEDYLESLFGLEDTITFALYCYQDNKGIKIVKDSNIVEEEKK